MAIGDDPAVGVDAFDRGGHVVHELVERDVHGAFDVPLPWIARIPRLHRELGGRAYVEESDLAGLEQAGQLVTGHKSASCRKSRSSSCISSGCSSGVRCPAPWISA